MSVLFVVAMNNFSIYRDCFASSQYVSNTKLYPNFKRLSLGELYNDAISKYLNQNLWLAFCHQDFILKEDLSSRLKDKNVKTVFGPIGVKINQEGFFGEIEQTDGKLVGTRLTEDVLVQTLDAQCLIAHSTVFRGGLRFDERLPFHFYDADFCMRAHQLGFKVKAMQINCQHKSKTLTGDIASKEYIKSLQTFKKKWRNYLPIKTSTILIARSNKPQTIIRLTKKVLQSLPLNTQLALGTTVKPTHLWLETTDKCNSHCMTCNIWKKLPTPSSDLVSLTELKRCFKDPLMNEIKEVLNSGGESTVIHLEDYLKLEHDTFPNATIQISTNALLPNRLAESIEYAMNIGVCHLDVGLSIDGVGEAHDFVRGVKGNFTKLEESIRLIKKLEIKYPNRIFTSMGSTLTDTTANNAETLYSYSKKVGIPFMWHWYNLSSFYENKEKPIATVEGTKKVILNYPNKSLYMDMWNQSLITGKIPKFKCLALQRFLVIRCNGDVVPCLSRWSESVGNIKKQSISEIWRSKEMMLEQHKIANCEGCLNSWGSIGWSINETYLPVLKDIIKRKVSH